MDWKGKRVVIIGAGRQGTATATYLAKHGAQVVLTDARPETELQAARQQLAGLEIEWHLGGHPIEVLDGTDLLCPSGGVPTDLPLVQEALKRRVRVSNDSQLFLEAAPCKAIGITGSAGKTTTTTLVGRIFKAMQGYGVRRAWVGGNLGNPLLADVDQMAADDIAVLELSSFQLEWMTRAPQIAAILNVAPNHLDRHGSMSNYVAAKARILDYQNKDDIAILNREDEPTQALIEHIKGGLWTFGTGIPGSDSLGSFERGEHIWLRTPEGELQVLPLSEIELIGGHNQMNVLAACAIAAAGGAGIEAMQAGVRGFRGAPHRLEWVRKVNGSDWYNDSIATAPQRVEAALWSFERPIVLLLGGRDKGLPWEELAQLAAQQRPPCSLIWRGRSDAG